MTEEKLIIHRMTVDIHVGDKEEFHRFANRISSLCKNGLPRKLNAILKKHKLPEGKLIIHKLELNLGKINPYKFEATIINAITSEVSSFLYKNKYEILEEISQAKFKKSYGQQILVKKSGFVFESEIILPASISIEEELSKSTPTIAPIDLNKQIAENIRIKNAKIIEEIKAFQKKKIEAEIDIEKAIAQKAAIEVKEDPISKLVPEVSLPAAIAKESKKQEEGETIPQKLKTPEETADEHTPREKKATVDISKIEISDPQTKEKGLEVTLEETPPQKFAVPKALTELDKAFLYYLKYGRLPSNVKYELGTSMLDVFNINQNDERFFDEVQRHIQTDDTAKERLIRLMDDKNKKTLIKKNILEISDIEGFDPRVPKAYEDYFTALIHGLDKNIFSAGLRRYTLNDMVRFLYADSPLKLRSLLKFLLINYPSKKDLNDKINELFDNLSKPSIVKIISAFARKGAHVNKSLNNLNVTDIKGAHKSVFRAFLEDKDPLDQLTKDGFDTNVDIKPRVFLSPEPEYKMGTFERHQIVDYFLTYGSLPYSIDHKVTSISKLDVLIQSLQSAQIANLPFFKQGKNLRYETLGMLSEQAIRHIVKSLEPTLENEIDTRFKYFRYNIEGGVPIEFQKAFMIAFALNKNRKSYLEEMLKFWKNQFGDADQVLRNRWKVKEELGNELNSFLHITEKSLADQLKVNYEFQDYSKDISVKNAGLIILWPFLRVYFNLLDLLNPDGTFRSMDERGRACHLLQYLAVKQAGGEEFYYPLNKILTGYPLDEPLPAEIKMTEKEINVSNSLLQNVIKQWNALQGSSVDGLRGSFLIRNGVLTPTAKGWLLTVERKPYDILLDKLPWGIGMIKISWIPYVIHVEWEGKNM